MGTRTALVASFELQPEFPWGVLEALSCRADIALHPTHCGYRDGTYGWADVRATVYGYRKNYHGEFEAALASLSPYMVSSGIIGHLHTEGCIDDDDWLRFIYRWQGGELVYLTAPPPRSYAMSPPAPIIGLGAAPAPWWRRALLGF